MVHMKIISALYVLNIHTLLSALLPAYPGTPNHVSHSRGFPSKHKRTPSVDLTLAQRLRRWRNVNPALCDCLAFAVISHRIGM